MAWFWQSREQKIKEIIRKISTLLVKFFDGLDFLEKNKLPRKLPEQQIEKLKIQLVGDLRKIDTEIKKLDVKPDELDKETRKKLSLLYTKFKTVDSSLVNPPV